MTKADLRKEISEKRKALYGKEKLDCSIACNLLKLDCIKEAETVLCYASLPDEIETDSIIISLLEKGKRVAVPRCRDANGNMDFFLINSLSELRKGAFGVREPDPEISEKLTAFDGSVIIVPALCFDENGNRLGYGKGYYVRFLKNYSFISVGLCYNSFIKKEIPVNKYDISVDIIVTESSVIHSGNGGKNG